MIVIVLVGGEGTRLRPLTFTTPKQLLPVAEVAMIERVLAQLAGHGVERAVLSMGYRPDAFLAAFPDDRCAGVALTYAVEPAPLDTAGAIAFAARHVDLDEPFLVVNGDVLSDADVTGLVAFHRRSGGAATIRLVRVPDPSPFGVVLTDERGRVTAFVEKPPRDTAPADTVNAGMYVLEPEVLERVPPEARMSIEREVFPALVGDGSLFAVVQDGYWIDAGTPAAYLRANLDLLRGAREAAPAPGARRSHDGWVLGGPVVDASSVPGSLVGDAAFVGRGADVRTSVVGGGARVEDATVVDSVLLPGAVVRSGARVERSIVGTGAVVGAGSEVLELSVVGAGVRLEGDVSLRGARVPEPADPAR